MSIMLGNLKVNEIEERLCIEFDEDDLEFMTNARTNNASGEDGKYHCFDIPFMIVAHTDDLIQQIANIIRKYDFKGNIQMGSRE